MRGMKFQFSLATLLICMTVLAVVCAICVKVDVVEQVAPQPGTLRAKFKNAMQTVVRHPTAPEVAWRMAMWGTPAIAATLAVLWIVRRVKSHAPSGPPGS